MTAFPAIEIIDSRFRDYPNAPLLDRIADCVSNGAFIRGALRSGWRQFDLRQLEAVLAVDGADVVRRTGGHPMETIELPSGGSHPSDRGP